MIRSRVPEETRWLCLSFRTRETVEWDIPSSWAIFLMVTRTVCLSCFGRTITMTRLRREVFRHCTWACAKKSALHLDNGRHFLWPYLNFTRYLVSLSSQAYRQSRK